MCSVGAVVNASLSPEEVRKIVLELLPLMIERGDDATGIAAYKSPKEIWLRKAPVPSTEFAKVLEGKRGWEEARIILLHARAYTSCPPAYNLCNHPLFVKVGDRLVSLVHNGVIYDQRYRGRERFGVDTEALLVPVEERGRLDLDAVREMLLINGSKAVIVTDGETVYAFRETNPLHIAFIPSLEKPKAVVMASTPGMLEFLEDWYKVKVYSLKEYAILRMRIEGDTVRVEAANYVDKDVRRALTPPEYYYYTYGRYFRSFYYYDY